jgi:hypothetical protein
MTNYKDVRYAHSGASVTAIPTSAFSSGTFADARISESSVTQHATAFDDAKLKSDVQVLALNQANNENKAAYNLPNSFLDVFQDDTGIGSETTGDRNASEYWQPNITVFGSAAWEDQTSNRQSTYTVTGTDGMTGAGSAGNWGTSASMLDGNLTNNTTNSWYMRSGANRTTADYILFDLGSGNSKCFTGARLYMATGATNEGTWKYQGSNDNISYTDLSATFTWSNASSPLEVTWSNSTAYRYLKLDCVTTGTATAWQEEIAFQAKPVTQAFSATGTLISTAETANAATTKVSGVILYQNTQGTATLGTDLKIYFTANGGTNWTESTPTAAGTFSSGILMAKCPEVTCTSGTDVRYKAVWANQSEGSKETRLQGVGMSY